MKTLRLIVIALLASAIALVLSDQVIYRLWLVPKLADMQHIPFYYHYFVLLPMAVVILIFGLSIYSWKILYIPGIVFALNHQCYYLFSTVSHRSGDLLRYATENPVDYWIVRSIAIIIIYSLALIVVWYSKHVFQKTITRFKYPAFLRNSSDRLSSISPSGKVAPAERIKINEDNMSTRITYHVLPDSTGWLVKKGKAKKASSIHKTKKHALRAASNLAKSHRLSQVIIHNASGIIEADRTFEQRHYKEKKKKREVIRKIKKGLKRSKRKEYLSRLRRRKAAKLGISRLKRKRYLRRAAAKKAARTRRR
jgi:hypothetical protein